jgi:hypothetical protein
MAAFRWGVNNEYIFIQYGMPATSRIQAGRGQIPDSRDKSQVSGKASVPQNLRNELGLHEHSRGLNLLQGSRECRACISVLRRGCVSVSVFGALKHAHRVRQSHERAKVGPEQSACRQRLAGGRFGRAVCVIWARDQREEKARCT